MNCTSNLFIFGVLGFHVSSFMYPSNFADNLFIVELIVPVNYLKLL
jgi:hypothetical protein